MSQSKEPTARPSLALLTTLVVFSGCYTSLHSSSDSGGPSRDQANGETQSAKLDVVEAIVDGAGEGSADAPSPGGGAVGYDGGRGGGMDGDTAGTGGVAGGDSGSPDALGGDAAEGGGADAGGDTPDRPLDGVGLCVAPNHDGGDGTCVAIGSCIAGYHDGGDGVCIKVGCASGYHDGGGGTCVATGICSTGYHDGGNGICISTGTCSSTFHNGGDGSCVPTGGCASGYHDGGNGICVTTSCSSGYHDSGNGTCVAAGTCSTGYHDGGNGTCVASGTCSGSYHDGGNGTCVATGACSLGYHDGGTGTCVSTGTCSSGYHDGGTGSCVATGCAVDYHDGGSGTCVATGSCSSGYHDGGTGICVATANCSSGYHDNGSGSCVANVFINGPCVTSPDSSSIEIFATSGQKIYRRVLSGSSSGSWVSLANLDATKLDARSDLDCSSNSNTVHVVASGASPTGSYMHAFGFGTAFNPFVRELSANTPSTFGYIGVSIGAWTNGAEVTYQMAAVPASGTPTWVTFDGTTSGGYTPTVDYAMSSAPDVAYQKGNGDNPNHAEMVAFTGNGMVYLDYESGYGSNWYQTYSPAPDSTTYGYSPTVCNHSDPTTSDYRRYTAAVAGGKLYSAYSGTDWSGTTFSAWTLAGNAVPASSPDCVVTSDNTLHIVVLTSTGTIAHVYRTGVSGSWTTQDLGSF